MIYPGYVPVTCVSFRLPVFRTQGACRTALNAGVVDCRTHCRPALPRCPDGPGSTKRNIWNQRDRLPRNYLSYDFPSQVEVTNNACERALRPAVIQRKVTNGFRSMWAAEGDCALRTVTDTAKLNGQTPFQTITEILA